MEATLNFNIPLSIEELANLIKAQLPTWEREKLAELLTSDLTDPDEGDYEEPTQAQLVAEIKEAVREVNLAKKGKIKLPTLDELLNEL